MLASVLLTLALVGSLLCPSLPSARSQPIISASADLDQGGDLASAAGQQQILNDGPSVAVAPLPPLPAVAEPEAAGAVALGDTISNAANQQAAVTDAQPLAASQQQPQQQSTPSSDPATGSAPTISFGPIERLYTPHASPSSGSLSPSPTSSSGSDEPAPLHSIVNAIINGQAVPQGAARRGYVVSLTINTGRKSASTGSDGVSRA